MREVRDTLALADLQKGHIQEPSHGLRITQSPEAAGECANEHHNDCCGCRQRAPMVLWCWQSQTSRTDALLPRRALEYKSRAASVLYCDVVRKSVHLEDHDCNIVSHTHISRPGSQIESCSPDGCPGYVLEIMTVGLYSSVPESQCAR